MEDPKLNASLGLALLMGGFMAALALLAVLIGLFLDRNMGLGRGAMLICILGSVPINMFLTLRLTQVFIKRIIPPSPPKGNDDKHLP